MRRSPILIVPFLFVACSHPLDGSWVQHLPDGKHGITVQFQTSGDRVLVHEGEGADHVHRNGTYTFDEATSGLEVSCELLGTGKPAKWTGSLRDGHVELGAADTKIELHRGSDPHGH